jgi:tetratricopeptide (TPR) repeat protein
MKFGIFRYIQSLIILVLLQIMTIPCSAQELGTTDVREESSSFETKFVEASILYHQEKYPEAIKIWEELLTEDRRNADVAFELSKAYHKSGKTAESIQAIDRAIRYDPGNIWFVLFKISLLEESARYLEASEVCDLLIQRESSTWAFYKRKADNLAKAGQFSTAAETLTNFEIKHDGFEELYQRKYDLYLADKNIPAAIVEAEKLVLLKPENTYYLYLVASHFQELGQKDKAISIYSEILRIDPTDARAAIGLNQLKANPDDKKSYMLSLQEVMAQKGGDVDAKILEIIPYLEYINSQDSAISNLVLEACLILVNNHPQNAKANALYGDALKLNGNYSEAIVFYKKAVSIDKRVYTIYNELLQLLFITGQFSEMKKVAEETVDYYPNQAKAVIWYAVALMHNKQYAQALSELNHAMLMSAGNTDIQGLIFAWEAKTKILQKQYKESADAYRKAVQISGGNVEVLSMALYDLTDYPATRPDAQSLATSIQKGGNVSSPEIMLLLARLDAAQQKKEQASEKLAKIKDKELTAEGIEYMADVLFLLGDPTAAVKMWESAIKEGGFTFRLESKIKENRVFP